MKKSFLIFIPKKIDKFNYKIALSYFMNTNPNAKRILCYGDSNTWGKVPFGDRYPVDVRWTGILQNLLGIEYEIIEEGLRARTTNVDDQNKPNRNGMTYLRPCLETHYPIDFFILWLGTNDLKNYFNRSAEDVADAVRELIKMVKDIAGEKVKILTISSPLVFLKPTSEEWRFEGAYEKSQTLGKEIEKVAREESTFFIDLVKEGISPDKEEGVHLSKEMHAKVAELFFGKIKSIF